MTLAVAAAAGVSLVATVVIPRTLGFFDATTSNPGNSFTAGTLTMTNDKTGALVVTVPSNMKPGDIACGHVTVTNSGSLPAQVELSEAALTGSTLESYLKMHIVKGGTLDAACAISGGSDVYATGAFNGVPITKVAGIGTAGTGEAAGDWNPSEAHTFNVVVTFPNSGAATPPAFPATPNPTNSDNQYQNQNASATLNWYSTQSTVSVTTVTP
ncbi:MAG TPA: TasA family protein [Candidatus Angelobacter sp.]|nr:TasA family protein [Candidatus Angelobacter sp.]